MFTVLWIKWENWAINSRIGLHIVVQVILDGISVVHRLILLKMIQSDHRQLLTIEI